jgi:hypothetical protein
MIEPGKYDITIHQGATFELNLQLKDGNGTPLIMSGYTVAGKVFDRLGNALITNFAFEWTNQAIGQFKLSIPASTTATISGDCQYDILVTEPTGRKFYALEGAALLNLGLTGRA